MLVDVVVAVLHLMFEHADDLVGNAVEAEVFAERILAGEEFLLRVGADDGDAGVREVVGLAEEAAFGDVHLAHAAIRGVDAADAIVRTARAVGDHAILEGFGRDVLQQRNFGADVVEIVDGEADLRAGLGASGLQFGAAGKDEDEIRAERAEGGPESALEAGAVGEQEHDRRDAPGHAEHGEHAAAPVVAQRVVGLGGEIEDHENQLLASSS